MKYPRAVFLGRNGYPDDVPLAIKDGLVPGKRYTITGCSIGQSSSRVTVRKKSYNSVMFGISIERLCRYFGDPYESIRYSQRANY